MFHVKHGKGIYDRFFNCYSNHDGVTCRLVATLYLYLVARLVRSVWKGGRQWRNT